MILLDTRARSLTLARPNILDVGGVSLDSALCSTRCEGYA